MLLVASTIAPAVTAIVRKTSIIELLPSSLVGFGAGALARCGEAACAEMGATTSVIAAVARASLRKFMQLFPQVMVGRRLATHRSCGLRYANCPAIATTENGCINRAVAFPPHLARFVART